MNYSELIQKQDDYFQSNRTKDVRFRIAQLKKLKSTLKEHEPLLYKAIYSDFKKSEFETYATELSLIYHEIDFAIKKLPQWTKRQRVKTNLLNLPGQSYLMPEPYGVCLIIGAWNYPYQLSLLPAVSAIASGNTIILKPSEVPLATSRALARMINETFPAEYLTVVEGGISETTALIEQKFDKIFFTGSSQVGKIIYQAAAKNLTPVTLELGGKSPAIVTQNCNLKDTAKRIVWSKFLNAGQTCIAPDYILVDEVIHDQFLLFLKEYIRKFEYSFENNNYVQIINERYFHRLIELIDEKKIYYGGETDLSKRYIAPTLLTGVTFSDKIMSDEIFGPILPLIQYSHLNDAIALIKSRSKPLACYIFTNEHAVRNKLLNEISFGGGAINDAVMHISNHYLPFGGIGNSGMGSYHGKAGFDTFTHFKGILDKPFRLETNLKYPPYTKNKLSWIKRLIS